MMAEHKYRVGQVVEVRTGPLSGAPPGAYEVTRRLPPAGTSNQYRVKSHQSGHERVIQEADIIRADH
jgi:hypothetical protein